MKSTPDPSTHQAAERQIIAHIRSLLDDPRFIIDTTAGRRGVASLRKVVTESDRGVELKRTMTEMNLPDRDLQNRMPQGTSLEVTLQMKRWWIFSKTVGRIRVICVSPTQKLLAGESPRPLDLSQTRKLLSEIPPAGGVPTTVVIVSTAGFEISARELAQRGAQRTVVLLEPNDAGGWNAHAPPESKAIGDLLDPEMDADKRERIRAMIEASTAELLQGGISADRLSARSQLPLGVIEAEVKSYAKANAGLVAKRLDGRVVLYRESTTPVAGGSAMPMIDKIKSLFARKGDTEKKISFLSERRAALAQQRDRSYEEIGSLESKDNELKDQFKATTNVMTRKRITSQLLQLRKDIERRQQMLGVLNQQMNVVGTHLHTLELTQQGNAAQLPDSDEIAADAAAAEEMLAELQANSELIESVGGVSANGLSIEEQALYEALEREAGDAAAAPTTPTKLPPISSAANPTRSASPREAEPG